MRIVSPALADQWIEQLGQPPGPGGRDEVVVRLAAAGLSVEQIRLLEVADVSQDGVTPAVTVVRPRVRGGRRVRPDLGARLSIDERSRAAVGRLLGWKREQSCRDGHSGRCHRARPRALCPLCERPLDLLSAPLVESRVGAQISRRQAHRVLERVAQWHPREGVVEMSPSD